ncbi:MAG: hypothetical protein U0Y96_11260 [Candidatus Kapaibacterium sp.]
MKKLFITIVFLFSCNEYKKQYNETLFKENWYSQFVQRDKNIIKRTINLLIDTISVDTALNESYYDMGGYANRKFNGEPELIEIRVDSILYNDDLTKCIAFVVFNQDNTSWYNSGRNYSCKTVYGIRDSIGSKWHYYPWGLMFSYNQYSAQDALLKVIDYYKSTELKHDRSIYLDQEQGKQVSFDILYNIEDKNFWDSCIVWKKNQFAFNTYPFQYMEFNPRYNKNRVIPEITIPLSNDEILSFKNEVVTYQSYLKELHR